MRHHHAAWISAFLLTVGAASALAQGTAAPAKREVKAGLSLSVEQTFGGGHSDAPGDVDVTRLRSSLNAFFPMGEKDVLNVSVTSTFDVYDFDPGTGPGAFGSPWDEISGVSAGVVYRAVIHDRWTVVGGGGVRSWRELGADFGDSLGYYALVGGRYTVSETLMVGLNVVAATELEEGASFYPIPSLDWTFAKGWNLATESARGPGLALEYTTDDRQWTVALRGRYESRDFRLANDNATSPSGIGIDRRVPITLDVDWNISDQCSINFGIGAAVIGRVKYEDPNGNTLAGTDTDPAIVATVGISLRF